MGARVTRDNPLYLLSSLFFYVFNTRINQSYTYIYTHTNRDNVCLCTDALFDAIEQNSFLLVFLLSVFFFDEKKSIVFAKLQSSSSPFFQVDDSECFIHGNAGGFPRKGR